MISKKPEIRVFKIIVIGNSGVGKTCLSYRFCCGKFPGKTEVTIGVDFREKCVDIDGEIIKLQIWDTAGQERFRKSMIQHYYRNVHAVVFVYDVTNYSTFESIDTWIKECEKYNLNHNVPRLIIANKIDCGNENVPTQISQQFADQHGMPLFETSALDDSQADHVESIFLTLAHKLKASKPFNLVGSNPSHDDANSPTHVILHRADSEVEHQSSDSSYCSC